MVATGAGGSPAWAEGARGDVPSVSAVLNDAAAAVAAAGQPQAGGLREGVRVDLPQGSDRTVEVSGKDLPATALGLPGTSASAAVRVQDKAVVRSDDQGFAVVAEPVETGVRGLVTIYDRTAPTRYDFTLGLPDGITATPRADGGLTLQARDGVQVGEIAPSWARDANGDAVPTHYELTGSTLTQVVEHRNSAAYPVVADPKLTWGFGVYLNLWGWEANAIGAALGIGAAASGVALCTASNIPSAATRVVKLLCSGGVSAASFELLKNLGNYVRSGTFNSNTCYQSKIGGNGQWVGVDGKNCE
ncbi:hypothetical protein LFM09_36520 [Lentzea alba]|uniref:hypothetical protein n=1 Tax=Lentzea alba TaxID=2714351 RepID=UPI0039BF5065